MTRPDLNGTRVRAPGTARVYLIDNGFRRAVPNIPAYEALFRDWEWIVEDLDVEAIRLGDPLGESAGLIKSGETSGVYFLDGTTRRQVANPQVMDKYRFAWERVRDVPARDCDACPRGRSCGEHEPGGPSPAKFQDTRAFRYGGARPEAE